MDGLKEHILTTLNDLGEYDFRQFKWHLKRVRVEGLLPLQTWNLDDADRMKTVDLIVQNYTTQAARIVENVLKKVKRTDPNRPKGADLEDSTDECNKETLALCRQEFKSNLKQKIQHINQWIQKHGENTRVVDIYTEVYITVGGSGQVNDEHEIKQIELAYRKTAGPETPINMDDIVEPLLGKHIKTAMMTGVAGIGKSVLAQKFALNWAEDKANPHIDFVFPFTFRELNLEMMEKNKYSMEGLLHHFFSETKEISICTFEQCKIVFIFDGLDECRPSLCFPKTVTWTDPRKPTKIDVLLTNLIRRNLLPKAQIWITTRPAAADQIPPVNIDRVTEVRGFKDPQKKEYFFKRFPDEQQASKIYSHIQKSRSIHIMCHIPVCCWITSNVMEDILSTDEEGVLPKTQTTMYLHFMRTQSIHKFEEKFPDRNPDDALLFLGKLAFKQLKKGILIFYEGDLKASGIEIEDAAMYSEVFTQLFGEVRRAYAKKMFCFVHLSVQEFLAAVHVLTTFINTGVNLLSSSKMPKSFGRKFKCKIHHLYKSAVDEALKSPNGHLDLFLRFLLGLSLETNQELLETLLIQKGKSFQTNHKTIKYIKEKIRKNPSPERCINLFHCLNELNDHSLEDDIKQYLTSGRLSTDKISPAQWSALVFVLLSSEKELDVFDLKKYSGSEEALLGLLPVLKASNKALLSGCNLSERCCQELSSALSSSSSLKEVDLSNNDLQDSGIHLLAEGLGSPHCMLETLKLSGCNLSVRCCKELSSALSSSSSLKEVDLSNNDLQDSGVHLLAEGLGSPHCMLETLNLSGCLVTETGCSSLTSALRSNTSHLRKLNLTFNHPGESGESMLSAVVTDPRYRLDTLSVDHGGECWLTPGLRNSMMNVCELTLDPNTAHNNLFLSENNREVRRVYKDQKYPPHPHRFKDRPQVMCGEALTGRCYCEVQCSGDVEVALTHRDITRQGVDSEFGYNNKSWRLFWGGVAKRYSVMHNEKHAVLPVSPSSSSNRVAVYLDHAAGTGSFYTVSSDTLTHLHSFKATFTQPLYVGFRFWGSGSSVSL